MKLRDDQGRLALAWRVIPIAFGLFLAANVVGLGLLGYLGRSAKGQRLEISWQSSCANQALPIMQERADSLGLGQPEWSTVGDQIRLTATMPGLDDDQTAVPALLARPGRLQLLIGTLVIATDGDLSAATLELDEAGMPYTQIVLDPKPGQTVADAVAADHDGELVFLLDGEELARRPNSITVEKSRIKIIAGPGKTRDRFRRATDRAIILGHGALPCAVGVSSVGRPSPDR